MTQPSFVDWTRYTVPGSDVVLQASAVPNPELDIAPVDTSPWSSIIVSVINEDPVLFLHVVIAFAGFLGAGTGQSGRDMVVAPGALATATFQNNGRTVALTLRPIGGTTTNLAIVAVYGTRDHISRYDVAQDSNFLIVNKTAYAVNQSKTFSNATFYTGNVMVTATSNQGGPAAVDLQYYDGNIPGYQTFVTLPVLNNVSGGPFHVFIPPGPLNAIVMNSTTAQTIEFYVIPELD